MCCSGGAAGLRMDVLQPSSLTLVPISARCTSMRSKKRKSKRHQQRPPPRGAPHENPTNSGVSYPRPSPTPLLLGHTPQARTREELLDQVLGDVEASVHRGVRVEPGTFSSLLETCFQLGSPDRGLRVRRLIPQALLRKDASLSSRLLRLYASCGLVDAAHRLFDEMPQRHRNRAAFAWNSLISGYAELGRYEDAVALYHQMEEEGVEPDRFTFPRVLKACGGVGSIALGEAVHRHVVRSGFGGDPFVLNALVLMYAKCGDILKARRIFDKMPRRDPITCNSMLVGYARHGLLAQAVEVLRGMLRSGVDPDSVAVSTILAGTSSSSKLGTEIHGWVLRRGLACSLSVGNALISMYGEHNRPDSAREVFESMPQRDVVSWNAIICAHRRDERVLSIFRRMENSGVPPDKVTFVSLLSACANMGFVERGRELFAAMEERFRLKPEVEHYGCMVNLLGRAGLVDEAYRMVMAMQLEGGPTVWGALLFACSIHGNVAVGESAAERVFELEPDNEHNFELLMKIYAKEGRWVDVEKVRRMMKERGLDSSYS
uniref:Pentatricopeptide repeat-containing protein At4g25270, chloroplastic n=1 Tax=Anthurium amnicola TaxID=1678845 RepID=A0A1D1XWZ4_9ARAE